MPCTIFFIRRRPVAHRVSLVVVVNGGVEDEVGATIWFREVEVVVLV